MACVRCPHTRKDGVSCRQLFLPEGVRSHHNNKRDHWEHDPNCWICVENKTGLRCTTPPPP